MVSLLLRLWLTFCSVSCITMRIGLSILVIFLYIELREKPCWEVLNTSVHTYPAKEVIIIKYNYYLQLNTQCLSTCGDWRDTKSSSGIGLPKQKGSGESRIYWWGGGAIGGSWGAPQEYVVICTLEKPVWRHFITIFKTFLPQNK